jgi:hypothetical protein
LRQAITWAADAEQFGDAAQTGQSHQLIDIVFVRTAGMRIGDVGEPFEFGRHRGELAELRRPKRAFSTATRSFAMPPPLFSLLPGRNALTLFLQ